MSKTNYLVRKRHKGLVTIDPTFDPFAHIWDKSNEEVEKDLLKAFPDANEKLKGAFERYKQKLVELKTNKS